MNFSLVLLLLTFGTGILWVLERFRWAPARRQKAKEEADRFAEANREAINHGVISVIGESQAMYERISKQPKWLEYTAGLFPVILFVFVLRSFIVEPFRIPSGSMLPTIHAGDFILVNKFEHGLRFPVLNWEITKGKELERGEIVVFKYPVDRNVDFIKRVIGLPGDEIRYINKVLYVNGVRQAEVADGTFFDEDTYKTLNQYKETLAGVEHHILKDPLMASQAHPVRYFPHLDQCAYSMGDMVCKVPAGHYFMMGDNRDNSADSRFWGFVPREDIVGRAFFIWLNLSDFSRIGSIE